MATVDSGSPSLRSFNSQLSSFPIWKSSIVEDLMTPFLNKQTVMMKSISPSFKSSHVSTQANLPSEFPWSDRSFATHPLQINEPDSLWDIETLKVPLFLTKTRLMILRPPFQSTDRDLLRDLGAFTLFFPPK
jgi:hypothetical protein